MPASADPTEVARQLRPSLRSIDLTTPQHIHVVGIGGAGMRAIARVLLEMGHVVSGSDRAASVHLDRLADLGATVMVGHDQANIADADLITRSTAVPDTNVEVEAALVTGRMVLSRAEILSALTRIRPAILVAGTHGKTTTSSMLAVLLEDAGEQPSFVIGSDVDFFGTGARWTAGDSFVVEADESDGTFLALEGAHAIVTSLDPDHLEFYGDASRLGAAFVAFVEQTTGTTAVCIDDPDNEILAGLEGVVTYGVTDRADLQLAEVTVERDATSFHATWMGRDLGQVRVGLPGLHNALNAAGALTVALSLGVDAGKAIAGLAEFGGVARRFETRAEVGGVRFVDDYAHLPAEVEAAVRTAKAGPWNRVIAAYQPHRFSRTEALGTTFSTSFQGVDHLVLTDIYPSGEAPRPGVTGKIVHDAVVEACPDLSVSWQPTLDDVVHHLAATLGPGDLCLTLGAGDLTTTPDLIASLLAERSVDLSWLRALAPSLERTTIAYDSPLGARTTYRVGGAARAVAEVGTLSDLVTLADAAATSSTPMVAVGNGSNLLVADRGFQGVAIVLTDDFASVSLHDTVVTLGAAASLPRAARKLVAAGLTGFEWAVGVPGTVGGAVVMNAGGHGSDMAASVVSADVVNLGSGQLRTVAAADLAFRYRGSAVQADDVVVAATLQLERGDVATGEALLSEIVHWRREHQPGGQNAGSVFTNPPDDSAGRLIDSCGLKGHRIGSAAVSTKHANFIQADPDGRADDIASLMQEVMAIVQEQCGVTLTPETRMVGFA